MKTTQTLIIGGGLCGLAIAEKLDADAQDYLLVEARDRLGGRIKTEHYDGGAFEMGPAWYWQGQPRIAALIKRLGLRSFEQFSKGTLTYENEHGQVQRGRGFASMEGSLRIAGGLDALINGLADRLPQERLITNSPITSLTNSGDKITVRNADGDGITAQNVILALPPRIAAELTFDPPLPGTTLQAMHAVPTWMAGQAKAVAVYDSPFWRNEGLSGDAMSRTGPLAEVHDASPETGGPYALFGFIGVPPAQRQNKSLLEREITKQLGRLFGPLAANPRQLLIKDWARDPFTAASADQKPLMAHPVYGLPPEMDYLWDGRLQCAGTEVASRFGGYLEGALEAAELVLNQSGPSE
jgi:monoamine oxidase